MARVYSIVVIGFAWESVRSLVRAFAGNVNAVGDANIAQLFDIIDRLQACVIISLVTENRVSVREM